MSFKDYFQTYEFNCKLPGAQKTVNFRPLTTKEIKKMITYEGSDVTEIENMLDMMIQEAVVDEDFNIDDLYLQDRFFLLVELRKKSKGEQYEFDYTCPNEECGSQTYIVINLDDLNVTELSEDVDNKIKLKNNDDVSIYIWFVTRGEEKEALNNVDKNSPPAKRNAEFQLNALTQGIKKVETPEGIEENLSFEDKAFIMNSLYLQDLDNIRDWYTNNNFGVDFVITKRCKQCGHEEKSTIPLSNFFA